MMNVNGILKQDKYYIELDKFIISKDLHRLFIAKVNKEISTIIEIPNCKDNYNITKYTYDCNGNFLKCNSYLGSGVASNLNKQDAFKLAKEVLDELNNMDNINKILAKENVYDKLNIISDKLYYSVINNDRISLSWAYRFGSTDISTIKGENLDIILNETKEKIGNISYDYQCRSGFTYGGNISYSINEEFRGNHYATDALKLLKELLKSNKYSGDKDLYISTLPMNDHSKKVALNNGGHLVYKGNVPKEDFLSRCGIDEVYVYQIKISHNDGVKRK